MPLKPEDLAYIAGLFDGEGSISVSRSPNCIKNIRVLVSVTMCDREGPDFIGSVLGGTVTKLKRKTKTGKDIYSWALYCKKAAAALELLLPYLKVKNAKAKDAILLAALMRSRGEAKNYPFTALDIGKRLEIYQRIRAANSASNGRIPHAVA